MPRIFLTNTIYAKNDHAPEGKPDTTFLSVASAHLEVDYRNAVWIDGHFVRPVGRNEDGVNLRLVVNGVVTSHEKLSRLVKSPEWPEEP